jgi:hypothetical protein
MQLEASQFNLDHDLGCKVIRGREIEHKKKMKGRFRVEHVDKDGNLKDIYAFNNDITNAGKNSIFDVYFSDATQIAGSAWVLSLISLSGYSALAAGDTMASHGGWTEFTGYSESTRPAWGPGDPASQAITNASPVTFSINATGTVKGIFVTSQSTKGGTTGTLWATALFTGDVPVTSGDQLKVTYTISA